MESKSEAVKTQHVLRSRPNNDLIKKGARLILEAKTPIVLVGNGCIRGRASLFVRKFVERTGIHSMNTFMAKGVISDNSKRHLYTIGIREAGPCFDCHERG